MAPLILLPASQFIIFRIQIAQIEDLLFEIRPFFRDFPDAGAYLFSSLQKVVQAPLHLLVFPQPGQLYLEFLVLLFERLDLF